MRPTLNHVIDAVRLFLTLVVGIATYRGVEHLAPRLVESEARVLVGGFTVALMVLLVVMAEGFFRRRGLKRLPFLVGYLLLAVFTMGLGFSTYWEFLRADDVSRESYQAGLDQTIAGGSRLRMELTALERSLADAAAYSEDRRKQELTDGGSCGAATKAVTGPRARLRQQDQALLVSLQSQMAILSGQLTPKLERLLTVGRDASGGAAAEVRRLAGEINALAGHAFLATLRQSVEERVSRGRGEIVDPVSNAAFRCPDAALDVRLTAVAKAAVLPALAVPEMEIAENGNASRLALNRLLVSLEGLTIGLPLPPKPGLAMEEERRRRLHGVAAPAAAPSGGLERADALPLFCGVLVESLIFLLTLVKGHSALPGLDARRRQAPELPPDFLSDTLGALRGRVLEELCDLLEREFTVRGRKFLAVPLADRAPALIALRFMLEYFESLGLLQRVDMDPRRVRRYLARCGIDASAGAEFVVYEEVGNLTLLLAQDLLRHHTHRPANDATTPAEPAAAE